MSRRDESFDSDSDSLDERTGGTTQLKLQVVALRTKLRNLDDTLFGGNGRRGIIEELKADHKEQVSEVKRCFNEIDRRVDILEEEYNLKIEQMKSHVTDQRLEKAKVIGAGLVIWAILQIVLPPILSRLVSAFAAAPTPK